MRFLLCLAIAACSSLDISHYLSTIEQFCPRIYQRRPGYARLWRRETRCRGPFAELRGAA